jgi:hypothetical protein
LRREIQSGWPRRSSPWRTWRLLGRSRRAHVWRRFVPIISFDDALVLYALLTLFGRHGEAAWRGQDDTGRTRAAFRAGGRQLAFRHRSQLCERPALLAHIFVRWHRPPTSGQTHPAADQSVAIRETLPVDSWVVNVIDPFFATAAYGPGCVKKAPYLRHPQNAGRYSRPRTQIFPGSRSPSAPEAPCGVCGRRFECASPWLRLPWLPAARPRR